MKSLTAVAGVPLLPSPVYADPDKNESGNEFLDRSERWDRGEYRNDEERSGTTAIIAHIAGGIPFPRATCLLPVNAGSGSTTALQGNSHRRQTAEAPGAAPTSTAAG